MSCRIVTSGGAGRSWGAWLCSIGGLLLALAPSLVGAAAQPDPLAAEERLAQPLDLAAKEEPLVDFLARVRRETGVPLEASEETADERVTLFARGRPVRELLARVAEHLDYTWVREIRNGVPRYRLIQDLAAQRRELALREGPETEVRALREQVEALVRILESPEAQHALRKPYSRRVARTSWLNERLTGERPRGVSPEGGSQPKLQLAAPLTPKERQSLEQELRLLRVVTPGSTGFFDGEESAAWLYALAPAEGRAALWTGAPLRFAFPPERGRLPIPRETATELGHGTLDTLASEDDAATGQEVRLPLPAVERLRGELALRRKGGILQIQVRVRVLGTYGREGMGHRAEWVFTEPIEHLPEPAEFKGTPLDPAVQALRDPITLRSEPVPPGGVARTDFVDLLEQIAAQVPYPILADGYLAVMHHPVTADRQPLPEVLRRPCRNLSRICRYDRGYLTFRDLDWATARATEPPARRVRAWERELERRGVLTWPSLAEIAARCPGDDSISLRYRWPRRVPTGIHAQLDQELEQSGDLLRLLYALPSPARRSLEAGSVIPLGLLPAPCQQQAREVIAQAADGYHGYENFVLPGAQPFVPGTGFLEEDRQEAAWSRATLSLRRSPESWYLGEGGFYPLEMWEQLLAEERTRNPQATEKDLKRVDGERVEVTLTLPGANPVMHYFLVATELANEKGSTR